MTTVVTIDAVDVSAYVKPRSIVTGPLDIGSRTRTAKCVLTAGTPKIPENDHYLSITRTDGVTLAFAGVIRMAPASRTPLETEYTVNALGWESLLDGILITDAEYRANGTSDVAWLSYLLGKYYGPIGTGLTHMLFSARSSLPARAIVAGSRMLRKELDEVSRECGGVPYWIAPAKAFHWNDLNTLAPFALSSTPNGGTTRAVRNLERFPDATRRAVRIRVAGSGVEYTATDWSAWAGINAKRANEPGAPDERFPQLPDLIDTTLETVDACKQVGWAALAAAAARLTYIGDAIDEGLEPGQLVDVFDTTYGVDPASAALYPSLEDDLGVPDAAPITDRPVGRLMIQRVTPAALTGKDTWRWTIEAGDPESTLESMGARGS